MSDPRPALLCITPAPAIDRTAHVERLAHDEVLRPIEMFVLPGGKGVNAKMEHCASLTGGRPGVLHGNRTYLLQDDDGQILEGFSISAGLDYPGIGPEHAWLKETGRAMYTTITDQEALAAFHELTQVEGIIPALESAHAMAYVSKIAPSLPQDSILIANLSGRGDKDVQQIAEWKKQQASG